MRSRSKVLAITLTVCLLAIPQRTLAQDGMLHNMYKGVSLLLEAVPIWNKAIDRITSVERRKQLQRRMFQLYREMQDLERRKENLLESIEAQHFTLANVETDVTELKKSIRNVRASLDRVSAELGTQQDFNGQEFAERMNRDLHAKFYYLIKARDARRREDLLEQLRAAIAKIREARKAVGECLKKLEQDL